MKCLVIQPIHPAGEQLLADAGVDVVHASRHDMGTVAREIVDADAAITRNAGLNRAAMEAASKLKVLGNHGIGVDPVDVEYATSIGLPVAYTPYGNVQSVAELAIAHMLAIAKRVREADCAVRGDRFDYRYSRDFEELCEGTLLIVGFGRIGRRTAKIAKSAFEMRILVFSPSVPPAEIETAGCTPVTDLALALAEADVVSLHQVLNDTTRQSFNAIRLAQMKKGAVLINTSRGALIDNDALIAAVDSGHLRGAAIDVFEKEPLQPNHPLTRCNGILLSPHIGGATEAALRRTAKQVASAVVNVLNSERPEHLVNPEVWENRRT